MTNEIAILLTLPGALLLGMICLPNRGANVQVRFFRQFVTGMAGCQFLVAVGFLTAFMTGWLPEFDAVFYRSGGEVPITLSVFYDGVSGLMFTLVSFVGWIVCKYSIRYLDGEATQGRFYRWTAFTLGAVSLMVISGNLLMFVSAWILTSLGLHQLLMHYGTRPAAARAAWTKFVISRIGDAALIAAVVVIYRQFGTLEFSALFSSVASLESVPPALVVAGFLLVAGAATKSAQFPFHTWLPLTLETPTPVSALMHAGIVNAGGYLIIRTSPLVSQASWALTALVLIGGFTACFGAMVMLTQTNIKKSLAYSTIAQMGFMLLQCGLGAYSAAMLHILAHSLYKAFAFLSSGSVIAERSSSLAALPSNRSVSAVKLAIVGSMMLAVLSASLTLFGINPTTKPGGLVLGAVLCLALTHWIGQVMRSGDASLVTRAVLIGSGLCVIYSASFFMVDWTIAASLPVASGPKLLWGVAVFVVVGFAGLFAFQFLLASERCAGAMAKLRIHASNGFYVESIIRRVFEPLVNC